MQFYVWLVQRTFNCQAINYIIIWNYCWSAAEHCTLLCWYWSCTRVSILVNTNILGVCFPQSCFSSFIFPNALKSGIFMLWKIICQNLSQCTKRACLGGGSPNMLPHTQWASLLTLALSPHMTHFGGIGKNMPVLCFSSYCNTDDLILGTFIECCLGHTQKYGSLVV